MRALDRRGFIALLLIGGFYCLAGGCAEFGIQSARQRMLAGVLHERVDHLAPSVRIAVAGSLARAEAKNSVDALLLIAVIEQESSFKLRAKSPKGALGLMQIRPSTAKAVAKRHGIAYRAAQDLYDPEINLAIGAAYLAELEESFGSWERALIAYHRGPRNLRKADAREKPVRSRYATQVMKRYRSLQALNQEESP